MAHTRGRCPPRDIHEIDAQPQIKDRTKGVACGGLATSHCRRANGRHAPRIVWRHSSGVSAPRLFFSSAAKTVGRTPRSPKRRRLPPPPPPRRRVASPVGSARLPRRVRRRPPPGWIRPLRDAPAPPAAAAPAPPRTGGALRRDEAATPLPRLPPLPPPLPFHSYPAPPTSHPPPRRRSPRCGRLLLPPARDGRWAAAARGEAVDAAAATAPAEVPAGPAHNWGNGGGAEVGKNRRRRGVAGREPGGLVQGGRKERHGRGLSRCLGSGVVRARPPVGGDRRAAEPQGAPPARTHVPAAPPEVRF